MAEDRRVHVRLPGGAEVVRYDRSGKWHLERPGGGRVGLLLQDAVAWACEPGADVRLGLPGGLAFDRWYQRRLADEFLATMSERDAEELDKLRIAAWRSGACG